MERTELTLYSIYRDGGTTEWIDQNNCKYYLDGRINSPTKGQLFDRHPRDISAIKLDQNQFTFVDQHNNRYTKPS